MAMSVLDRISILLQAVATLEVAGTVLTALLGPLHRRW